MEIQTKLMDTKILKIKGLKKREFHDDAEVSPVHFHSHDDPLCKCYHFRNSSNHRCLYKGFSR